METVNLQNILRGLKLVRMLDFDPHSNIGPLTVDIAVTSTCNYRCVFCGTHSYLRPETVKPQTLAKSRLIDLLADLEQLGTRDILFAGNGEPLLSDFMVELIKLHGSEYHLEIMTNGSLLDKVDRKVFDNLFRLTVSLNSGNGKTHQLTHGYKGENQFPQIVNNIERLLSYKDGSHKVELNYVITKDNRDEMEDFYRLAGKWGVRYHARPVDASVFPDLQIVARPTQLTACYMGFIRPSIIADGAVLQCYGCTTNPLGNLYQNSFQDIWKSGRETRLKAARMAKSGTPLTPGCYGCANAIASGTSFEKYYSKIPFLARGIK